MGNSQKSEFCLKSELLQEIPNVFHGFGCRLGPRGVLGELAAVRQLLGIPASNPLAPGLIQQEHGVEIATVVSPIAIDLPKADGAVTEEPSIYIGVRTADCLPVLVAGKHGNAVGVAHSGWKGTLDGIAKKLVQTFWKEFGVAASDLIVSIGPAIGACCYQVSAERIALFLERYPELRPEITGWQGCLDLGRIVQHQLELCGVPSAQIEQIDLCTECHPELLFSFRRGDVAPARQFSAIAISRIVD